MTQAAITWWFGAWSGPDLVWAELLAPADKAGKYVYIEAAEDAADPG